MGDCPEIPLGIGGCYGLGGVDEGRREGRGLLSLSGTGYRRELSRLIKRAWLILGPVRLNERCPGGRGDWLAAGGMRCCACFRRTQRELLGADFSNGKRPVDGAVLNAYRMLILSGDYLPVLYILDGKTQAGGIGVKILGNDGAPADDFRHLGVGMGSATRVVV